MQEVARCMREDWRTGKTKIKEDWERRRLDDADDWTFCHTESCPICLPGICQSCASNAHLAHGNRGCECDPGTYEQFSALHCVATCGPGQFPDSAKCHLCDTSCADCSGAAASQCTDCYPDWVRTGTSCSCGGYREAGTNVCKPCHITCETCDEGTASDCLSCHLHGHVLEPDTGICICDDGYYALTDTSNCQSCHPSCGTCLGPSPSDCSSCLNFAQLSGASPNSCRCAQSSYPDPDVRNCVQCAISCFACKDADAANCLSCYQGAALLSPAPSSCDCGEGYFASPDAANCARCNDMCLTCSSLHTCLSCKHNAELLPDSSCVCSAEHYGDPENCFQCSTGCQVCTLVGCITCLPQWFLHFRECVEVCPVGRIAVDSTCIEGDLSPPEPLMEVNSDNSMTISFSQSIYMNLTGADISVEVTDLDSLVHPTNWSEPLVLNQSSFMLKLVRSDTNFPYKNQCILTFLHPASVVSLHAVALVKDQLVGTLYGNNATTAFNPNTTLLKAAATAVAKGSIGAGAVASIINGNPGSFWSLLNQIQLMTYIPMTKMPLSEGLMATLGSLDVGTFVPNPFSYFLPANSSSQAPPEYAKRYEVDSALFLLNTGLGITSGLGLLIGLLPVYIASRVTSGPLSLYLRRFLPSFKWGIPLRWWIQSYLDIAVYSLLQVQQVITRSGLSEVIVGLNFLLSAVFAILVLLSPVLIYLFLWRNYKAMDSRQDLNFNKRWGVLYTEFDQKQEIGGLIFYPLFLTRRLAYALTIIYLYDYPQTQALINISMAVSVSVHLDRFVCIHLQAVSYVDRPTQHYNRRNQHFGCFFPFLHLLPAPIAGSIEYY